MHDFGSRIRPDEITPELRNQLVGDNRLSEALLQCATFIGAVAISLLLSLVYRWHGEIVGSEWRPIGLVILLGVLTMIGIRIWFHREYQFLKDSAVTVAEVEDIEDTGQKHYLTLKFEPGKEEAVAPHPEIVTAEVHTDSPAFNEELHPGDLVSVLYEPGNPEHVELVEQEHLAKAK